jgi:hypothetical protein
VPEAMPDGGRVPRQALPAPHRARRWANLKVVLWFLGVLATALAATALAQGIDVPLERYREAMSRGEVGTVRGRAFAERRKPSAADLPLAGTVVALLPRSDAWLVRLQAIKRGARDSVETYRDAAPAVRRSHEAYEKSLWEAGAADLPRTATVDAEGVFTLDNIPAGTWILLASRSTYVNKTPPPRPSAAPPPVRPPSPFLAPDKLAGYHVVTYWFRELTVAPGAIEALELTDRNAWLTGVREDREKPRLPDRPYEPPR